LSVPILDDRSTAKRRETMANDRLLHFMLNSLWSENDEWNDVAD
jgi:hypothetical protein